MVDVTFNGMTLEFDVIAFKMDPALKAEVQTAMPAASEQALLDAYMAAHRERFGKDFLQG